MLFRICKVCNTSTIWASSEGSESPCLMNSLIWASAARFIYLYILTTAGVSAMFL